MVVLVKLFQISKINKVFNFMGNLRMFSHSATYSHCLKLLRGVLILQLMWG